VIMTIEPAPYRLMQPDKTGFRSGESFINIGTLEPDLAGNRRDLDTCSTPILQPVIRA
jgi:hypothetical protein